MAIHEMSTGYFQTDLKTNMVMVNLIITNTQLWHIFLVQNKHL